MWTETLWAFPESYTADDSWIMRSSNGGQRGDKRAHNSTTKVTFCTITRNTHAHLCLAPVCRLCVRVICGCRWGMRGKCYGCRPSCLVLVVFKPRWHRHAVVPDLNLHHQRTLSSTHLNVSDCVTHIIYGLYLWYVTTFRVTFLSMTHHVHTYFVRIDPRFRASC